MHTNANQIEHESEATISKRQRMGWVLLAIFGCAYAGFIGLCTFATEWVSKTPIAGVPLTVVYGVVLIVLSITIACVYGALSRSARPTSV